jgi:hypothetical protein
MHAANRSASSGQQIAFLDTDAHAASLGYIRFFVAHDGYLEAQESTMLYEKHIFTQVETSPDTLL